MLKSYAGIHKQIFGTVIATSLLAACTGANSGHGDSSNASASSAPLLVADKAMKDGQTVYQSPIYGGLRGNLYIQPRSSMAAPDTETVGCSQAGLGALGIDAYTSQPSWATQQLLFTSLYVPTRNFAMGFPAPDGSGSILPVRSYFVIDVRGNFHLAPGETEGDYQFAMIADDGAKMKLGDVGGVLTTIIDDEKPASYDNGSCLSQTQSAHMSCSTDWSDQSAVKIRTVHLKPGQSVPMEVMYWQGPGYGLSMMAFYRKVANKNDAAQLQDAACGQEQGFGEGEASLTNLLSSWTPITFSNLSASNL